MKLPKIKFDKTHIVIESHQAPPRSKQNLDEFKQEHSPVRRAQDLIETLLRDNSTLTNDDQAFLKEFARGGFRVGNLTDNSRDDLDWRNQTIKYDVRHNFGLYCQKGMKPLEAQEALAGDFDISLSKVKRMLKTQ